jgi:hypothetical protein
MTAYKIYIMKKYKRSGNKWTINECLRLQREFELLDLSVYEISLLHERSPNAIMYKLDSEGFAEYNKLAYKNPEILESIKLNYNTDM